MTAQNFDTHYARDQNTSTTQTVNYGKTNVHSG